MKHSAALHHLCDPNVELDENENIGEKGLEEEARMMASQLAESESQLCAEVLDSAFDPDCKEGGSKRVKHRSDNETTLSRRDMLIQLEKLKLEILQGSAFSLRERLGESYPRAQVLKAAKAILKSKDLENYATS